MVKEKILIIFLSLIYSSLASLAQVSNFFINSGGTNSVSIDTATGGGYFVNNFVSYSGIGTDFFISKIKDGGVIQWQYLNQQFDGADSSNRLYMIIETADGGVIGVGNIRINQFPDVYNCLITCIDSSGNLVWQREYDLGNSEFPKAIYADADSTFLIASLVDGDLVSIKINTQGDSLWTTRKVFTSSYLMDIFEIRKAGNSYYYFGRQYDTATVNTYYQGIYKIDSVGTFLWEKIYPDSASVFRPLDFRTTQSNDLLSFNFMLTYSNDTYQQINKYDLEGNISTKYFPILYGSFASDSSILGIYKKTFNSDTSFVGTSNFYTNQVKDYSYLNEVSLGIGSYNDFLFDRNNSILISGRSDPSGFGYSAFLAKFSDTLNIGMKELEQLYSSQIVLFPIPAFNVLNISVTDKTLQRIGSYSISIYNSFGKKCSTMESLSNNIEYIDISDLAAGFYYYIISTNQNEILSGKLIIN